MEQTTNQKVELQRRNNAFNNRLFTFAIVSKTLCVDIPIFMEDSFAIYRSELQRAIDTHNMVKSMTVFVAEFEKEVPHTSDNQTDCVVESAGVIKQTLYFATGNKVLSINTDLSEHYKGIVDEIRVTVSECALHGSGFVLSKIIELNVQVSSYNPLNGSTYIKTPTELKSKRAIVNVRNNDDLCFAWAVLSALHPADLNSDRVQNYFAYLNELNFDGIQFPVSLKDIGKFMRQNPKISINVYFWNDDCLNPLLVNEEIKERHIHLLLLMDDENPHSKKGIRNVQDFSTSGRVKAKLENGEIKTHFCWIKDMGKLIGGLSDLLEV